MIFVAPSVDSLSACSILTALMRREAIKYTLIHISCYEELQAKSAELLQRDIDLRSVVMINMGAVVDLSLFLGLDKYPDCSAFVVDYHRPVHQRNIHNAKNVVVFADTAEVPAPRGTDNVPQPEPMEPEEARDSNEGGEDENNSPLKRQRMVGYEDGDDDGDDLQAQREQSARLEE